MRCCPLIANGWRMSRAATLSGMEIYALLGTALFSLQNLRCFVSIRFSVKNTHFWFKFTWKNLFLVKNLASKPTCRSLTNLFLDLSFFLSFSPVLLLKFDLNFVLLYGLIICSFDLEFKVLNWSFFWCFFIEFHHVLDDKFLFQEFLFPLFYWLSYFENLIFLGELLYSKILKFHIFKWLVNS